MSFFSLSLPFTSSVNYGMRVFAHSERGIMDPPPGVLNRINDHGYLSRVSGHTRRKSRPEHEAARGYSRASCV
jgi:hypothetical protein